MAISAAANNVIGAIGGVVLAACLLPQVWRLYKTRSAFDIAYGYLALYATGLALTFVYLYFEGALVAWICMLVETAFCVGVLLAKVYLDHWGPHSPRGKAKAASVEAAAAGSKGGEGSSTRPGWDEGSSTSRRRRQSGEHVISVFAEGSARGGSMFSSAMFAEEGSTRAGRLFAKAAGGSLRGGNHFAKAAAGEGGSSSSGGGSSGGTRLLLEVQLPTPAAAAGAAGAVLAVADAVAATAAGSLDGQQEWKQLIPVLQQALAQQVPGGRIRALPAPVPVAA